MHLQTSWHAISGHKMGMLIHSPPKTIHKRLPILKKSSHLSGTGLFKIWNPGMDRSRIAQPPASFPEVSISRLRTASKIENITAMKNRSSPVPNSETFLMFPHGPHDEFLAECPKKQSAEPMDPKSARTWSRLNHVFLQCFFTCKRGKLGKWPSRRNTELSPPQVWVNI